MELRDLLPRRRMVHHYMPPDPRWSAVTSRPSQPRRPLEGLVYWERWDAAG